MQGCSASTAGIGSRCCAHLRTSRDRLMCRKYVHMFLHVDVYTCRYMCIQIDGAQSSSIDLFDYVRMLGSCCSMHLIICRYACESWKYIFLISQRIPNTYVTCVRMTKWGSSNPSTAAQGWAADATVAEVYVRTEKNALAQCKPFEGHQGSKRPSCTNAS